MLETTLFDMDFTFETHPSCFSPNGVDRGTLAMLRQVKAVPVGKVLDLGCGYGVVGIVLAKRMGGSAQIYMCDVQAEALRCAQKNIRHNHVEGIHIIESDGFTNLNETGFDLILSNPPYHTDFSIAKSFIEKGFNRLQLGGKLMMVTKRKDWYKNKLTAIFGGVTTFEDDGYYIFTAEKRTYHYSNKKGTN